MTFKYRAASPIAAALVLAVLSACSRTQADWRIAQRAGTAQAFRVFVVRHPDSELAGVARQRIAQLNEEAVWQQATRANTAAAYQDYLARYPNGSWSQDARIRMESRSLAGQASPVGAGMNATPASAPAAAAAEVPGKPGAAAPAAGAESPAAQPPARGTIPAAAGAGHAAVQLGAFSSAANANTAWTRLSAKYPQQLRGLTPRVVSASVSGRRLYRLEARVPDRAAARRLCRELARHSQGCLPVP